MTDIIGQTLGQYRIESVLGSGGMGQVYKGTHMFLDRPAAIKVMQANMATNPTFRSRFLQEAKTAAALRHPNVVEIYDYGDQDGQLYLVMELMTDGSLRTLLKQYDGRTWPLALALDLVRQAALGLAAANAMNMVHRDIKPDNLLLNKTTGAHPSTQPYILKISDFGLARLVEGEGLTAATAVPMGTLAYMSPEQCQGKKVDDRSDIYSLGIVLYEVTTGLRPFKIESFVDALNKHSSVAPPPPRQQRPDLPPIVEEIILRCLAKRPEDRYATANDLARDLQRALSQVGGQTIAPSAQGSPAPSTPLILPTPVSGTYVQQSGTYVQPPESVAGIPPKVSTLPGIGDAPRVRVLDQSGNTVQTLEVRMQGLTLGRQAGNDIVLNEHGVSRHHLQIVWDGQQVSLTDLGSSNGTYLEGIRLIPQVSQVWQNRQMVRVGSFWLRLEGMDQVATMTARGALPTVLFANRTNAQTTGAPAIVNSTRIGLSINTKTLTITPGQPTGVRVTLTNLGNTVDWFTTTIEGVPPDWVQGTGQEVQLNPGMQETVDLNINVARSPLNRAQEYPVIIRARSREKRNETNTVQAQWTVQPYHEGAMRIEPRRVTGRGSAVFNIAMQNSGNVIERYEMSGEDDEQKLSYGFGMNPVNLEPGREARIGVRVGTRRHWLGREQRYPFQIHSRVPSASTPATAPGEFVNKALIPGWVIPLVGVVLAVGLVVSSFTGLIPIGFGKPGATPTPGATIAITTGPSPDTQGTVNASINATATAQANAEAATQTATANQANATATAVANGTVTAIANATATAAAAVTRYNGTWLNDDPNTRDIPQLIVTSSGQTLTIHGYGACLPTFCDWGTVSVQFTGEPIIATFVFDGSRPGACCTGAPSSQLTITTDSADPSKLTVVDTNLSNGNSFTNTMHKGS